MTFGDPQLVHPDFAKAVFLDRVLSVPKPDYEVYGKTTCVTCDDWCWLDERTYFVVVRGQAAPLCIECGQLIPDSFGPKVEA